jgi:hypothetical protein
MPPVDVVLSTHMHTTSDATWDAVSAEFPAAAGWE